MHCFNFAHTLDRSAVPKWLTRSPNSDPREQKGQKSKFESLFLFHDCAAQSQSQSRTIVAVLYNSLTTADNLLSAISLFLLSESVQCSCSYTTTTILTWHAKWIIRKQRHQHTATQWLLLLSKGTKWMWRTARSRPHLHRISASFLLRTVSAQCRHKKFTPTSINRSHWTAMRRRPKLMNYNDGVCRFAQHWKFYFDQKCVHSWFVVLLDNWRYPKIHDCSAAFLFCLWELHGYWTKNYTPVILRNSDKGVHAGGGRHNVCWKKKQRLSYLLYNEFHYQMTQSMPAGATGWKH